MTSASISVHIWVRPEVFELGVLPILSPSKISLEMLSRFLHYCIELGESAYPKIGYHTWKHISVKKMGLTNECAMVIFYTCLLFSQQQPNELRTLEAHLASSRDQSQRDDILSKVEVVTLELVLLLYLHRFSCTHPRLQARQASIQTMTVEPWPGFNNALSKSPKKQQLLPEEQYVNYIKDSLSEILSLLSGQLWQGENEKKKGEKRSAKDLLCFIKSAGVLSPDIIQAMGFILGVSCSRELAEEDLLTVATDKHYSCQSGYLNKPKKKSFQKGLFEQWVLRNIDWAPHGEWLCARRGIRVNWPIVTMATQSSHKIVTSPSPCSACLILVSDIVDGMAVHDGDGASPSISIDLKIRRCSKSNLYILRPVRNVFLHKCFDCRIILGPVSGRLRISDTKNSIVVCPARSVVLNECRSVVVHTLTPQRPLLVGSKSHGITLAPLNFHYPKMLQHLNVVSLQSQITLWNRPLHLGIDGIINGCCDILTPEDFYLLPMPFSDKASSPVDGRPPLLPPGLPHDFVKSIDTGRRNVSSLREEVREADLTKEQKILFQRTIDARFEAWLKESGKQKELDLLKKMDTFFDYQRVTQTTYI